MIFAFKLIFLKKKKVYNLKKPERSISKFLGSGPLVEVNTGILATAFLEPKILHYNLKSEELIKTIGE